MEDIKSKLQKLISKRDSAEQIGNLAEAQAFAAKVSELLLKHNLQEFQLQPDKHADQTRIKIDAFVKTEAGFGGDLLAIIAQHNMCICVTHRTATTPYYSIIGDELSAQVIEFTWEYLYSNAKQLAKAAYKESGSTQNRNTFLRSYYKGFLAAIYQRLKELRKQETITYEGTNLPMFIGNKLSLAQEYAREILPNLRDVKAKVNQLKKESNGAYYGKRDGSNISLNKQIK